MRLPGGYWNGAQRQRDFAFGPITGELELALLEQAAHASLARRVTLALSGVLSRVGDVAASADVVHGLATGDRQFLVRQLARALGRDTLWITATCDTCRQRFDVQIEQSALPVKEAGDSFPFAAAQTSWGLCRLRVPTGADQETAAALVDDRDAVRALARCCVLEGIPEANVLGDADIASIERAVEAVAPEAATVAETKCPACEHTNRIYVDPYACLANGSDTLWDEIHDMASAYHWSESAILGLPRERRHRYLSRIARERGIAGQVAGAESGA
jgi:hypothetical protein